MGLEKYTKKSEFLPYKRPQVEFEPGSLSEHLLEFDTRSKPLGHQSHFFSILVFSFVI